jgi:hypothetical protein
MNVLKCENMKRLIYIAIAFLTFSCGVVLAVYFQFQSKPMSSFDCSWSNQVSRKSGYDIHNTKSRLGEDVDFYHEFTSPETTRYLFQSNSEGDELVEKGFKLNANGEKIGERGVYVFPNRIARIYWTEGDEFWFVQASSLKLARKVESQCFAR